MKKSVILAASFAVLALGACSSFEPETPADGGSSELVPMTFEATSADNLTRTYISGTSILWSAGDCIGVATGTSVNKFQIASGKDTGTATFSGEAPQASTYYAIYPYNVPGSSQTFATMTTEGTFTTGFCAWYSSLKAGSLSNSPCCAVSSGNTFAFKSVGAVIKFSVPSSLSGKVTKVKIVPCAGEKWVGQATVDLTGDTPVVTPTSSASTYLTVKSTLTEGDYYCAVAPVTLTKGLYLVVEFTDGESTYYAYPANGANTALASNKIYNIGTVSDSDEFTLTSFNNGDPAFRTTCYMTVTSVNNSAVKEGDTGKCLKITAKGSGASQGQLSFDLSSSKPAALVAFPNIVRKAYNKTRIRVWLGDKEWYPTVIYMGGKYNRLPSSINGVSLSAYSTKNCTTLTDDEESAYKLLWKSALKTNDWNEVEWDMADWDTAINWASNAYLNFYMTTTPKGGKGTLVAGDTYYLDNIRFGLSTSARTTEAFK